MPNVRIDPTSGKHTRLKALVQSRRDFARRELSGRHEKWRESERLYRTFVDPDEKDAAGNKVHPFEAPIVLPLTYALTQTQLAFDLSAFTQRRPMIPLDGSSPEDVRAARVMEQVLHHEDLATRRLVDVYGWLLDRRRYGVGFMWNSYTKDVGFRTKTQVIERPPFMFLGMTLGTGKRKITRTQEPYTRFEGNESWVADPYKVWWDPRVAIHRLQTGEFAGRTIRLAYGYMREKEAGGFYQNVSAIPKDPKLRQAAEATETGGGSDRDKIMGLTDEWTQTPLHGDTLDFLDHGYVDLDEGVFRIIPRDYELSGSTVPEKWWVTLANNEIVVRAEPFDPDHQQYPLSAMEASPDPHSRLNPGSVEILAPLNRIATWFFNSHKENVVKFLNDWLLVNPGVIELKDLLKPTPGGKLVRIKREFYTDPSAFEKAIKQLPIQDVTRSHMADLQSIVYMAQQVGAAPENLQGILSRNERTLGEQQMALNSASNRLKVELQLAWVQGVHDWTFQRISNIQQYMTEDRFVKVVGAWPRVYRMDGYPFLRVSPADVQGRFTYEVIDGTVQGDKMTEMMAELWKTAVGDPVLRQVYDTEHWFEEVAIRSGFSNIEDFLRQQGMAPAAYSVMPDEQVAREVERGNLVGAGGPPLAGGNRNGPAA